MDKKKLKHIYYMIINKIFRNALLNVKTMPALTATIFMCHYLGKVSKTEKQHQEYPI